MAAYIALLRAVNVMGSGKLPMTELKRLCEEVGFKSVRTYIASGNVVFKSAKSEAKVKAMLEAAVAAYTGKAAGVLVRTAAEMAQVHADNPFKETHASHTLAIFLDEAPPAGALDAISGKVNEVIGLGKREIYVYYADGVGESKLKIPAAKNGTARNMNTIAKLAELAAAL
jgi:uncharacterized protein (DUF1697 family)